MDPIKSSLDVPVVSMFKDFVDNSDSVCNFLRTITPIRCLLYAKKDKKSRISIFIFKNNISEVWAGLATLELPTRVGY